MSSSAPSRQVPPLAMPSLLPLAPGQAHTLLLLYLSLAFAADSELDPGERDEVVRLFLRWVPTWTPAHADHAVDAAVAALRAGLAPPPEELAAALRSSLSRERRRRVLADLGRLACADGHVLISEADVIRRVRRAWDRPALGDDA